MEMTARTEMKSEPVAMPKGQDFTTSFTVDKTPAQAYAAIVNVRGWWHENIEGPTDVEGMEFTYHNEPIHRAKIRVTQLIPGKLVVWRVLENELSFVEDQNEWVGNDMVFEIGERDGKTEVTFTQIGLVPDYDCYDICDNAWTGFIRGSLRALIITGRGAPTPMPS
jgi:hypothetical protein